MSIQSDLQKSFKRTRRIKYEFSSKALTDKQQDVLEYISEYQANCGDHPTLRNIQSRFSLTSVNSASQYIDSLIQKGKLYKTVKGYRLIKFQESSIIFQ